MKISATTTFGGLPIGTGFADASGTFTVDFPSQSSGQVLYVYATDPAGNQSDPTSVQVP